MVLFSFGTIYELIDKMSTHLNDLDECIEPYVNAFHGKSRTDEELRKDISNSNFNTVKEAYKNELSEVSDTDCEDSVNYVIQQVKKNRLYSEKNAMRELLNNLEIEKTDLVNKIDKAEKEEKCMDCSKQKYYLQLQIYAMKMYRNYLTERIKLIREIVYKEKI